MQRPVLREGLWLRTALVPTLVQAGGIWQSKDAALEKLSLKFSVGCLLAGRSTCRTEIPAQVRAELAGRRCRTASPSSASSASSVGFGTRFSPASRSGPAHWRSRCVEPAWGICWSRTPSPAPSAACWWSSCARCPSRRHSPGSTVSLESEREGGGGWDSRRATACAGDLQSKLWSETRPEKRGTRLAEDAADRVASQKPALFAALVLTLLSFFSFCFFKEFLLHLIRSTLQRVRCSS